jgi:hypothetical protein
MKASIEPGPSTFHPMRLVIDIETPSDLAYLWNLFNLPLANVEEDSKRGTVPYRVDHNHYPDRGQRPWTLLNDMVEQFDMKKELP